MYVLVDKQSMALLETVCAGRFNVKYFKSERSAKGWLTKMINNGNIEKYIDGVRTKVPADHFIVMEASEYSKVEPMVERVSLMGGKKYTESINTPIHCSPSSETYWSM